MYVSNLTEGIRSILLNSKFKNNAIKCDRIIIEIAIPLALTKLEWLFFFEDIKESNLDITIGNVIPQIIYSIDGSISVIDIKKINIILK